MLGQIVSESVRINGVEVASGTTLLNCSFVETGETSAFIHIPEMNVVEMARDSAAYFERTGLDTIQIKVNRGAVLFREESGATVAVPGGSAALPNEKEKVEPGQGLVTVLTHDASAGRTVLRVTNTAGVVPKSPILIVSPDGNSQEIHYVRSKSAKRINVTAGLRTAFPARSLIYQGSRIDLAVATGTPIVGKAAAVKKAGAGGAGGASKAPIILLVAGGGAVAGAAFAMAGGDGGVAPPATQVTP
jgi:hypothetical protein